MYNFTSTRMQTLQVKYNFTSILVSVFLLFVSISSIAQSTGIAVPGSPLTAPQQFTTNLIAVNDGGNVTVDGNIVILDNTFSNSVNAADAVKTLRNPGENFDLIRDGVVLLLEQRNLVVISDTLFYQMSNLKAQNYLLEFFPINMNLPGLTAILVDKYLNVRTPVNMNTAPVYYSFLVSGDPGSFAADRFMLILFQTGFAPLPVNFISVAANKINNGILVNWKVAAERNIRNYSIEKSTNGRSFNTVGNVAAANIGNNDRVYSFTDAAVQNGTVFYRIKSIGNSDIVTYSSIVKVSSGSVKAAISVSPNPVVGNIINLQLVKSVSGRYDVNLFTTNGRLVYSNRIQHAGGNANFPLTLPSRVANGSYILNIITPENVRQSQILLVGAGE